MVNYSEGKIYKIEAIDGDGEFYTGSTTKKHLCQRMSTHRGYYKLWKEGKMNKVMSFELFDKYGIENCYISLIENVNAKTKDELLAREAYYIKSMNCLNKLVPLRTYNEWKDDNQQKLNDYCKEYYENNKKEIISKVKIYSSQNQEKIKDYKKKYR